jgi:phosphoribosylaminoimidazole-succinocarboxamide synthase
MSALLESDLPGVRVRRGKVRDVYDLGDKLLLVATDRISAFDWVMPTGIPDKGRILTQLSKFWFQTLPFANHLISTEIDSIDLPPGSDRDALAGRTSIVRKCRVAPVECVVRGYLEGSGWKEYQKNQSVCGIRLPPGLVQCSKLPEPIFTPATKAEQGHDENISFEEMKKILGDRAAEELRQLSLEIYGRAASHALTHGIIIADTKFEFGTPETAAHTSVAASNWILIDEVLTPDSSRFWPADKYEPGRAQPSFDKQFLREWLETTAWDKNSPPPALPEHVVVGTRAKYLEAYERLAGKPLSAV